MVEVKQYKVISVYFTNNPSLRDLNNWNDEITRFLNQYLTNKQCILFELAPAIDSIIYDLSRNPVLGKTNGMKYLYSEQIYLTQADLKKIVEEDKFYLGRIIILLSEVSSRIAQEIVQNWDQEIMRIGQEFFKLDSDGSVLSWYNPSDTSADEKINNLEKKIRGTID